MSLDWFCDLDNVVRLVLGLSCVGSGITAAEDLIHVRRFNDRGLLSWEVTRTQRRWLMFGPISVVIDLLVRESHLPALFAVMLVGSLMGVMGAWLTWEPVMAVAAATVLLCIVLAGLRNPFGTDGTHQLRLVTFTALTVALLAPAYMAELRKVALAFIGFQAVLSYFVAGVCKAISPVWRDGRAIVGIMSTASYGNELAYRRLRASKALALLVCWFVILVEVFFPIVLLDHDLVRVGILGLGLTLHVGTAVLMSLNVFTWQFAATYPAVLFFANLLSDKP